MTKLYLVRHGESEGNFFKVTTGQIDMPLTDLGRQQARKTAEYLSEIKFDSVYSSDLSRAFETCKIINTADLPVTVDKNLREIDAGKWEGVPYDQTARLYPEDYAVWRSDIGRACPTGGESVASLYSRVNAALDNIAAKEEGKTVLIATHATPIRCIICRISGLPVFELQNVPWVPNASVTVLDFADGHYEIKQIGYAGHLAGIETCLPERFPGAEEKQSNVAAATSAVREKR